MGGKGQDDERDGFPDNVFEQMQAGHDKYMRELHEEATRFQKDIDNKARTSTANDNLFVSFKNFIDSNLDSLADSFRKFPSNIAELRDKMEEERERRKQEESDIWKRWTGLDGSPDHFQLQRDRADPKRRQDVVNATLMLLREARDRSATVAPEKIEALFRDDRLGALDAFATPMLSPGGACYYQRDNGYNAPSTAIFRSSNASHRWLSINWFKRSPYSPISLEQEADLEQPGGSWRGAFEDLISVALDKPMESREQWGYRCPVASTQSTRNGPGLDWMLSLQCRGILPPQLPSYYNTARSRSLLLTDQFFEEQARSIFGTNDIIQLAEEVATPAAPTIGLIPDYALSSVSDGTKKEHFRLRVGGLSSEEAWKAVLPFDPYKVEEPNHALEDYQMQLMLLEQHNKQRLLQARKQQALMDGRADDAEESDTELARYEHVLALAEAQQTAKDQMWHSTGDRLEDIDLADEALEEATSQGDVRAARQCLAQWHRLHGSVVDLIETYRDRSQYDDDQSLISEATLNEALIEGSWMHGFLKPLATQEHGEDDEALEDRDDLVRRGVRAAGVGAETLLPHPTDKLKEIVEGLEQQRAALSLDSKGDKQPKCPFASASTAKVPELDTPRKVDVLSSLTTTQTTRLADGTVTTKVVLKQRFADGREESEEKVHTYRADASEQQQGGGKNGEAEKKKAGGWFWS
ncbi:hypothetical protein LTR56_001585 [Elasticomyces elasticus]|nr:hypothetical protein LTR56_001585 [Elasticomyces elasticus]KAK3667363.1 hypothetical protein LTR22_001879 [Elasticomyces elasticus]KAK4932557.1 hypothetical protein LTR49_000981 [Elasticomyces elasticus]KAK5769579.1 hypothetical protein LTS12_000029 [Elasticomyces elasticus]